MDSHATPTVDVSAFRKGGPSVPVRITDDMTTLEVDSPVVATTRFGEHAAGLGASLVKLRKLLDEDKLSCRRRSYSRSWQPPVTFK